MRRLHARKVRDLKAEYDAGMEKVGRKGGRERGSEGGKAGRTTWKRKYFSLGVPLSFFCCSCT
jgi:hypothetical protein